MKRLRRLLKRHLRILQCSLQVQSFRFLITTVSLHRFPNANRKTGLHLRIKNKAKLRNTFDKDSGLRPATFNKTLMRLYRLVVRSRSNLPNSSKEMSHDNLKYTANPALFTTSAGPSGSSSSEPTYLNNILHFLWSIIQRIDAAKKSLRALAFAAYSPTPKDFKNTRLMPRSSHTTSIDMNLCSDKFPGGTNPSEVHIKFPQGLAETPLPDSVLLIGTGKDEVEHSVELIADSCHLAVSGRLVPTWLLNISRQSSNLESRGWTKQKKTIVKFGYKFRDLSTLVETLVANGAHVSANYDKKLFNNWPLLTFRPELRLESTATSNRFNSWNSLLVELNSIKYLNSHGTYGEMKQLIDTTDGSASANQRILIITDGSAQAEQAAKDQVWISSKIVSTQNLTAEDLNSHRYFAFLDKDSPYAFYALALMLVNSSRTSKIVKSIEHSKQSRGYTLGEPQRDAERRHQFRSPNLWRLPSTKKSISSNFPTEFRKDAILTPIVDSIRLKIDQINDSSDRCGPNAAELTVIIPIFNNGYFLLGHAFASLLTNNGWCNFQIFLVDDGSTDSITKPICKWLSQSFPNVEFFELSQPASGSASRPRNFGLNEATTPYVTFLDPDNEISDGGYDSLLRIAKRLNASFVSGYQLKIDEQRSRTGFLKKKITRDITSVCIRDDFFSQGVFPVISSQAAVLSTESLKKSGVQFLEGAVGQDTLFGWEYALAVKNFIFTDKAFIRYYAGRTDSVTNKRDLEWFKRSVKRETRLREWLEEVNLLEEYTSGHLERYFTRWYIPRLREVSAVDRDFAHAILLDIWQLYHPDSKPPEF